MVLPVFSLKPTSGGDPRYPRTLVAMIGVIKQPTIQESNKIRPVM
jgi:hypothetical protein